MKAQRKKLILSAIILLFAIILIVSVFCGPTLEIAEAATNDTQTLFSQRVDALSASYGFQEDVEVTTDGSSYNGTVFSRGRIQIKITHVPADMWAEIWSKLYYKVYYWEDSGWCEYIGDTCFATMFYHPYYSWFGEGTTFQSRNYGFGNEYKTKTVNEYCGGVIEDNTQLQDFITDCRADKVIDFNLSESNIYRIEIKSWALAMGGTISTTAYTTTNTTCEFIIDQTAPTLDISCGDYDITKDNVKVNYSDETYIKTGVYGISTTASYPTGVTTEFLSGTTFSDEGNYKVNAIDAADNASTKYFTIDKTAPKLSLVGVSDGGATNSTVRVHWDTTVGGVGAQLCNDNDVLTIMYGHSVDTMPDETTLPCTNNTMFSDEGNYIVTISDKAGNSSTYSFTIDTTAPTVVTQPEEYINHSFVFSATDNVHVAGIEYRKDNNATVTINSATFSVVLNEQNYGTWKMRAFDDVGNYTEWVTSNLYYRTSFGSKDDIYNAYYVPSYYVVSLPSKVYSDISGKYTFADYNAALAWTVQKEWEYRVVELAGEKWSYVNIANESVYQVYTDRVELDNAVNKYAASYISDRKVMTVNGGALDNPTDSAGITRPDALTSQLTQLPEFLSEYDVLPYMFIRHNYAFTRPIIGVTGNTSTLTVKYISDGISKLDGLEAQIEYGVSFKTALDEAGMWKQGYYLVTERDKCGNTESYVLCVDSGEPTLSGTVGTGDGSQHTIEFTKAYVEQNAGVMRYVSIEFNDFIDTLDEYVMLNINGRGINDVSYVKGDELPCLSYENGYYGVYAITVYDRSLNVLSFNIQIAGAAPTLSWTSLTNETKCTLTIVLNDTGNAITSVKLFKVTYTGELIEKSEDDDGTPISSSTLTYVLRTGGKYVVEFTDVYGRTVTTDPLFYLKGLPIGTLSGVRNEGLTNGDVTFTYDATCSVILYAWQDGAWLAVNELMQITDGEKSCVAAISAGANTSYKFRYFLYVTEDMNLFTEYTFEIDCIPPEVICKGTNGDRIALNGVTTDSFSVAWEEVGYTAYFYNKSSTLGSLGQEKYTKDTVLTKAGTYVFEVYDKAGNLLEFTVTLDNLVSWTLESPAYQVLDNGYYITKYNFVFTVTERTSVYEVTASNGLLPANGQKIDVDGTYALHIIDAYGNVLDIVLIVDNLPPVAVIRATDGTELNNGCRTNKAFTLVCDEQGVIITYAVGNGAFKAYENVDIDEEGAYVFKLVDRMGNSATVTVTVDRGVSFTVRGSYMLKDGIYYSRTWLTVSVDEECNLFSISNDKDVSQNVDSKIEIEGKYLVTIIDVAGNSEFLELVIDKTAPNAIVKLLNGQNVEHGATVNGAFLVYCEESDCTINVVKGTTNLGVYDGAYLTAVGTYTFTVYDFLGNSDSFTLKIDLDVDFVLGGNYVEDIDGNYLSKTWISVTMRESCNRFYIESDNGRNYAEGDRIAEEGVYSVVIEDANLNRVSFYVIIDRTAPKITFTGVNAGGSCNNDVQINIYDFTEAYYRVNGDSEIFDLRDGVVLSDEGTYAITAKDLVGNEVTSKFTIDKSVDVTPSRALVTGQIITGGVTFTFGETVTALLEKDGAQLVYLRGSISDVGNYELTVTDKLGNVAIYEWQILAERERSYAFEFPEFYSVSVLKDADVVSSAVVGNTISLTENGVYTLYFEGADNSESFYLSLIVDKVKPTVKITQERNRVLVSEPSKENLTYELYKDGKSVNFKFGDEISDVGNYTLIVSDSLGNRAEYSFDLHYINAAGIAVIVIVCTVVALGIIFIIVARLRQRIR